MYFLGNPIHVCSNTQNRTCFSEMIDLRGHMPRFTLKMNIFPSISLETPSMSVETRISLLSIYIHKQCNGMQGLCAQLNGGPYPLSLYIYI